MSDKKKLTPEEHKAQIEAYARVISHYKVFATALKRVMENACETSCPDALVQARAKSLSSFAEKCVRRQDRYKDAVHEMTDLCGGRVIVQTSDQVRAVRQFIEANFEVIECEDKGSLLGTDQFGYRDLHYNMKLKPERDDMLGIKPEERDAVDKITKGVKPEECNGVAEIQVRTWVQHAWADTLHDRIYKNKLKLSTEVRRTGNLLAALMEEGDRNFNELAKDLDGLIANYSTYATKEEVKKEIAAQKLIISNEPDKEKKKPILALKLARLMAACGDYTGAVELLEPHSELQDANRCELLLELGFNLCRLHRTAPSLAGYQRGRRLVEEALVLCGCEEVRFVPHLRKRESLHARALYGLGWVLEVNDKDVGQAGECYQRAHEHEPANPYYLAGMLGFEMYRTRSTNLPEITRTTLREAIKTCRQHAEAEIELPYALFTSGRLHLLLDESERALASYARGLRHCLNGMYCVPADVIDGEIEWVQRLHFGSRQQPASCQRAITLLTLGRGIVRGSETATPGAALKPPVLIVAGGAASMDATALAQVQPLIDAALKNFCGTVISGGTTVGVPGCVGDVTGELAKQSAQKFQLVGYAPKRLPHGVTAHGQYGDLIEVGDDFSVDQILCNWTDILAAGIKPEEVLLLGFGGGVMSALEYRLALGLGAAVGLIVANKDDAADTLLKDPLWSTLPNLYPLPHDKTTVRAFVIPTDHAFEPKVQEEMAKSFHGQYVANSPGRLPANMRPWDNLDETFKKANLEQAKYSVEILVAAGFGVRKAAGVPGIFRGFTDDDIERMAEMEHGRWNVERLRDGWRFGERNDAKKLHNCLVPWDRLPEDIKHYDYDAVRAFPEILAKAGLEVYSIKSNSGKI